MLGKHFEGHCWLKLKFGSRLVSYVVQCLTEGMSADAVTHEALVECGIYFTSSPGYAVYSDATAASAETDRIEARVNTVTRLQSFWAADVDDSEFFMKHHVQEQFLELVAALSSGIGAGEHWVVAFGEGPFGEAGGLLQQEVAGGFAAKTHCLADCIGYLLQQAHLYYYIGEEMFISRCASSLSEDPPRPKDWTTWAGLTGQEVVQHVVSETEGQRLTVVVQPKSQSSMKLRLKDDCKCIRPRRATTILHVDLCGEIAMDGWSDLCRRLRRNVPLMVLQHLAQQLDEATRASVTSSFWANSLYILHPGPSTVICRREVHPWVDETASALIAQLRMAHGNAEEALHTPAWNPLPLTGFHTSTTKKKHILSATWCCTLLVGCPTGFQDSK